MARRRIPTIFVVSDGRGETCGQLLRAALVQFEGQRYRVTVKPNIRDAEAARAVIDRAAERNAVVFYTLVGEEPRRALADAARRMLVPVIDVLGPAFSALHDLFKAEPSATPGLLYASERESFDRHAAIDYTLKHDDGQRPNELKDADVVIVGVSRASKSSTCFYLAYEGVQAANVPLVPGIALPAPLLRLDPERVIGLRVNVSRLMTVREARAWRLGLRPDDDYLDRRALAHEVTEANRTMERHGWRSFDALYMAIEETAREVMRLRGLRSHRTG